MSRLIDAVSLVGNMMDAIHNGYNAEDMLSIVNEQPTIDAVPVVRCRNCKHKRMVMKSGYLGCDIQCCLHPYDWFCPDGEKVKV